MGASVLVEPGQAPLEPPETAEQRVTVFVSYSRKDRAFAAQLVGDLNARGFDVTLDTKDIAPGEDWQERLGKLIAAADTMLFLISPDSMASPVCGWEIDEAERLSKRIMPVVCRPTPDDVVPGRIRRLNYIFMDGGPGSSDGLAKLTSGLRTSLHWIREHTRLGEMALRWSANGEAAHDLLHGPAIGDAERWISSRPADAPEPTTAHRAYIQASRAADLAGLERERTTMRVRNRMLTALSASMFAMVAGLVGWINQDVIKAGWFQFWIMRPYLAAHVTPFVQPTATEPALQTGESFRDCRALCPEMVTVAAGSYLQGAPPPVTRAPDTPQIYVTFTDRFAMGKFEVTVEEWDECVRLRGCEAVSDNGWGRGRLPATNISWNAGQAYAAWLSKATGKQYRLPTDAEWEYAARAGTTTKFPFGDDIEKSCEFANIYDETLRVRTPSRQAATCNDGFAFAAPVGSFPPNKFGLHDMIGNVWEWTENCFRDDTGIIRNGTNRAIGPCVFRGQRGGSYENSDDRLRVDWRDAFPPHAGYQNRGLRLVREICNHNCGAAAPVATQSSCNTGDICAAAVSP